MARPEIRNLEGIVLHAGKGTEGGRSLSVFTREMGLFRFSVSLPTMKRYGTGVMLPLSCIRFSASLQADYGRMSQYEGRLLLEMMKLTYEEMNSWYYVIELVLSLFPMGERDLRAYTLLQKAAMAARSRNPRVCAFVAAVQLLAAAGYDPAEEEPAGELGLSEKGRELLSLFRNYSWEEPFGASIPAALFRECARYLDRFIFSYCDVHLKTEGAFL